jgi:hypothetical protein
MATRSHGADRPLQSLSGDLNDDMVREFIEASNNRKADHGLASSKSDLNTSPIRALDKHRCNAGGYEDYVVQRFIA